METLLGVVNYIQEVLPNGVNSTTIYYLLNNNVRKVWKDACSTESYYVKSATDVFFYKLPANCNFEAIVEKGVSISDSTETAVTSTHNWTPYTYAGQDEALTANQYYFSTGSSASSSPCIGLSNVPTTAGHLIRIKYIARPNTITSTIDTTTIFNFKSEDYVDVIRSMTLSDVAKVGNYPDIELANNYFMDAQEQLRHIKKLSKNKRTKNPRMRWSYKEGW
jgi:hypothetical protein